MRDSAYVEGLSCSACLGSVCVRSWLSGKLDFPVVAAAVFSCCGTSACVEVAGQGLVMTAEALRAGLGSVAVLADFTGLLVWVKCALIFRGDLFPVVTGRAVALSNLELVGRPNERKDRAALAGRPTGDPGDLGFPPVDRADLVRLSGASGLVRELLPSWFCTPAS